MGTMQRVGYLVLGVLMTGGSMAAFATTENDDHSWFGHTGATSLPVKDADGSGHWWWPTVPASNDNDEELWGNRGLVYSQYTPSKIDFICDLITTTTPPPPEIPEVDDQVTRNIPIPNNVLFDFDSAVLKPDGLKEIESVVTMLKEYPTDTVIVEGHTCDMGPEAYNLQLSTRRAESVAKALVNNGIDAKRVTSIGYGESNPEVENTSRGRRMLNRRVVIVFKIK